jgi:hypothetical protein
VPAGSGMKLGGGRPIFAVAGSIIVLGLAMMLLAQTDVICPSGCAFFGAVVYQPPWYLCSCWAWGLGIFVVGIGSVLGISAWLRRRGIPRLVTGTTLSPPLEKSAPDSHGESR